MTRAGSFHRRTPVWCWLVLAATGAAFLPGGRLILRNTAEGNEVAVMVDQNQSPDKTAIVGRVLDVRGKPLAEAQVAAIGRPRSLDFERHTLAAAATDVEGRYRLVVPELSSVRYYEVHVIALAAGRAVGSQLVPLDVKQPDVVIRLADDEVLHGRVVDCKGFPAANAMVCVRGALTSNGSKGEGVFLWDPQKAPSVWPKPAITDAQGRFALSGVNTSAGAYVQVVDDRFAMWHFEIGRPGAGTSAAETRRKHPYVAICGDFVPQAAPTEQVTLAPPPSQIIEGQVLRGDTRQPAAHARVSVSSWEQRHEGSGTSVFGQADAAGRYRLNPFPGRYFNVAARPADGEPYLARQKMVQWPDDTGVYRVQVECPRGVLVRGKITESPSGRPVGQADIQYEPHTGNKNRTDDVLIGWQAAVKTREDGTFQIAVPPGKGTLVVQGPPGYVLRTVGSRELDSGRPGGVRNYVHATIPLNLDANASPQVQAVLTRGATVRGRLVGPEGALDEEAVLSSYLLLPPFGRNWSHLQPRPVRGGEFVLYGVDPDKPATVYVLDAKNLWGAKFDVSARNAAEPMVVRLSRCGQAEVRYLDEGGKPVEGQSVSLRIVFTAGVSSFLRPNRAKQDELRADEDFYDNFDRQHYDAHLHSGKDGRCLLPALIPGATYRLCYESKSGDNAVYDFVAESGKTIRLPDFVVKRPTAVRAK